MAKIDDNFRISLNIKWLGQIIVGVGILVMGYLRIENRIGELERRVQLADTNIEDLVSKHIEEEDKKITQMQEQLEWYQTELNLNPLSWGKKKKKEKKVILTEDDFNHNYFINREVRRKKIMEFMKIYSEAGMIGVVGALLVFMVLLYEQKRVCSGRKFARPKNRK